MSAKRTLVNTSVRLGNATSKAVASVSNQFRLVKLGRNGRELIVSCVFCHATRVSIRIGTRGPRLGVKLRLSNRRLDRIVIVKEGGLRDITTLRVRERVSATTVRGVKTERVTMGKVSGIRRNIGGVANVSITSTNRLVIENLNSECDVAALGNLPVTSPGPSGGLIPLGLFPSSAMRGVAMDGICGARACTSCDNTRVSVIAGIGVPRSFLRVDLGANKSIGAVFEGECRVSEKISLFEASELRSRILSVPLISFSRCIGSGSVFGSSFTMDRGATLPSLNKAMDVKGGFGMNNRALDVLVSTGLDGSCRGMSRTFRGALRTANGIRDGFACSDCSRTLGTSTLKRIKCALERSSEVNCAFFCTHGTGSACRLHGKRSTRNRLLAKDGGIARICSLRGRRLGKLRFLLSSEIRVS